MKVLDIIAPSPSDRGAVEMSLPNVYKNPGIGSSTKLRKEKATVKSSATGKEYGRKTLLTKAS